MSVTLCDDMTLNILASASLSHFTSLSLPFQKSSQKKTEKEVVASFLLPPGVKIPYLLKILGDAVRPGLWTGHFVLCLYHVVSTTLSQSDLNVVYLILFHSVVVRDISSPLLSFNLISPLHLAPFSLFFLLIPAKGFFRTTVHHFQSGVRVA